MANEIHPHKSMRSSVCPSPCIRDSYAGCVWFVAKCTLVLFIALQLYTSVFQGERLRSDSGGTDVYDHVTADNDRLARHW